jgi:hypothetical protein
MKNPLTQHKSSIWEYIRHFPNDNGSYIYFYEDRLVIEEYNLVVPYAKIKHIGNTTGKQRDSDRLAIGIIALPLALAYLWKKDYTYTIVEYDDRNDIQKIVLDFHKNVNYAQALIYKKMLERRKAKESQKLESSSYNSPTPSNSKSPIRFDRKS